jgi:hypothetical protein
VHSHTPPPHDIPGLHALPQEPQLDSSLFRNAHFEPQGTLVDGQSHTPLSQVALLAHAL